MRSLQPSGDNIRLLKTMKHLSFLFHIKNLSCLQELPIEVEKVGDEGHEDVAKSVVVLAQRSCYQPS
jgi:hypothetical protein